MKQSLMGEMRIINMNFSYYQSTRFFTNTLPPCPFLFVITARALLLYYIVDCYVSFIKMNKEIKKEAGEVGKKWNTDVILLNAIGAAIKLQPIIIFDLIILVPDCDIAAPKNHNMLM